MNAHMDCTQIEESVCEFAEGTLAPELRGEVEAHLRTCATCRGEAERIRQVRGLLAGSFSEVALRPAQPYSSAQMRAITTGPRLEVRTESAEEALEPYQPTVLERLGGAPWWGISVALHVLLIMLVSLITMAIGVKEDGSSVVCVTNLEKVPTATLAQDPPKKQEIRDILESNHDTPATDPNSTEQSNIVVPPDILAKAELGDHFETINPDRPDTHSAFGNPDAQMFHSVSGNDEPPGGGGTNGTGLSDELIGVGGNGSMGTGGGWGGGNGTGTGNGTGAGHGSFGARNGGGRKLMVMRHGGSKATESAVDKALEWLARHQENDGYWHTEKYLDNKQVRYGGGMEMFKRYDPGMTGFAALAFLGAGHSMRVGKYKDQVRKAIFWLVAQQGPDGDFTAKVKPCAAAVTFYCHCIATLACAEALAMNNGKDIETTYGEAQAKINLRDAVQRGVDLILKWQNENTTGGWTYYAPTVCDVTVSGWAVMALKSAKIAGIKIPPEAFRKASDAVAKCMAIDKTKGDYGMASTGYLSPGSHQFGSKGYAITAASMVIQEFVGADRQEAGIDAAAAYVTQPDALPQWIFNPADPSTDHQNLYFWYYGTLGCFQKGGDTWKLWNEKLKAALLPHQRVDARRDGSPQDVDGSWDPDDCWGAWGGRVYSTCIGALCLEVYYRYLPLYK